MTATTSQIRDMLDTLETLDWPEWQRLDRLLLGRWRRYGWHDVSWWFEPGGERERWHAQALRVAGRVA